MNGGGYNRVTGIARDNPATLLTRLAVLAMMAREIRTRQLALITASSISRLISRPNVSLALRFPDVASLK